MPVDPNDPNRVGASPDQSPPVFPVTTAGTRPIARTPQKKGGSGWVNILLGVAVLVAVGGVAFAVGRTTAPAAASTTDGRGNFGGFPGASPGASFPAGGFPGGGFGGAGVSVSGKVVSMTGDTLTLQLTTGNTIQLTVGPTTTYHQQTSATSTAVSTGSTVMVTLDRGARGNGAPGASNAPAASGAPGGLTGTATDVTVVAP